MVVWTSLCSWNAAAFQDRALLTVCASSTLKNRKFRFNYVSLKRPCFYGARATTMLWPRKNGASALASGSLQCHLEGSELSWRAFQRAPCFFLSLPLNPKPSWGSPSVVPCVKDKLELLFIMSSISYFGFEIQIIKKKLKNQQCKDL